MGAFKCNICNFVFFSTTFKARYVCAVAKRRHSDSRVGWHLLWDLRSSHRCCWRWKSSGTLSRHLTRR